MAAIEDAEGLVRGREANSYALQYEPLERVVLEALAGPVPPHMAMGVPLLRFANGNTPIPLLQAVMEPPIPRAYGHRWYTCDIDGTTMREPNTLWIPCGASVVQVTVRNTVRSLLMDLTSAHLTWE